jgi:hypothetical protein
MGEVGLPNAYSLGLLSSALILNFILFSSLLLLVLVL